MKPGQDRAVGDLDLEHVALGADARQVDRLEHLAPDALEAAGEILHGDAQDRPRVQAAAAADQPPREAPVPHPAAGDVARAEHQVGDAGGVDQLRQISGSWEKSASISITSSAPSASAREKPAR